MSFHKILCATDFSPGAEQAVRMAVRLAKRSDAELVIEHVWHVQQAMFAELPFPAGEIQRMVDDQQRALDAAVRQAAEQGARVTGRMLDGVPWDRIVATVHDDPAFDLLVLGTHGRTGVKRVLLGSVAEKVVRYAPCPVLVTRGHEAAQFRRVLVPVDFTESARDAVRLASELIEPDGELTLLHVVEVPVAYSGEHWPQDFLDDLDRRSANVLDRWATELRARRRAPVVTRTRLGSPGAQVLAVLDEPFDLVVTGSHGRTGLRRALLGSVAEKIVRHATCPVLVARKR